MINKQAQVSTVGYITQIQDFQLRTTSDRNWLLFGFFVIVSFSLVWLYEYSRRPKIAQIPIQDLRLSPAQVSFLIHGPLKPEFALASTFLDWKRRGFIQKGSFSSRGFTLLPTQGPLLKNEDYLMHLLIKICHSRVIDFSLIQRYRKNYEQDFYQEINTWFVEINRSLSQRQLTYKPQVNHGHSLVYGLLSANFFFLGFIGLYLKSPTAFLVLFGAGLYLLLGLSVYGKYPPKGQAVFYSLIPIKSNNLATLRKKLTYLDEDHLYLYGLSLGRFFNDLNIQEKLDPYYVEEIRRSFTHSSISYIKLKGKKVEH